MKANHNRLADFKIGEVVVVNLANWQNESKSQQLVHKISINNVVVNLANWQNESKSQPRY